MEDLVKVDIKLQKQIELIDKYLTYLEMERSISKEEFGQDKKLQAAVERWLQTVIESCINIGSILISMKRLHRGENFADIFIELNKADIIPDELTKRLIVITKFRNKLVHVYWDIEPEVVYDILENNLNDIKDFVEIILNCI